MCLQNGPGENVIFRLQHGTHSRGVVKKVGPNWTLNTASVSTLIITFQFSFLKFRSKYWKWQPLITKCMQCLVFCQAISLHGLVFKFFVFVGSTFSLDTKEGKDTPATRRIFCGRAGGNQRYSIRVLADLKIYDNMLLVGGQQFTGFHCSPLLVFSRKRIVTTTNNVGVMNFFSFILFWLSFKWLTKSHWIDILIGYILPTVALDGKHIGKNLLMSGVNVLQPRLPPFASLPVKIYF